ncbi:hypothetical protein NQZ68_008361 [Dissostichus eleginoides]|nr:hypothetical protein NQZ68_008361 [Dissostichus eleginoides]
MAGSGDLMEVKRVTHWLSKASLRKILQTLAAQHHIVAYYFGIQCYKVCTNRLYFLM